MMNEKVRRTRHTMFAILIIGLIVSPTIAWTPTEEDLNFVLQIGEDLEWLSRVDEHIVSALEDENYKEVAIWADIEYDYVSETLDKIDQYEVSPELQPLKEEYILTLLSAKNASYYLKKGAEYGEKGMYYFEIGDWDKSIVYLDLATSYLNQSISYNNDTLIHLQNCIDMLDEIPTPAPISTSESAPAPTQMTTPRASGKSSTSHQLPIPGFEAVFVIGILLVIARFILTNKRY